MYRIPSGRFAENWKSCLFIESIFAAYGGTANLSLSLSDRTRGKNILSEMEKTLPKAKGGEGARGLIWCEAGADPVGSLSRSGLHVVVSVASATSPRIDLVFRFLLPSLHSCGYSLCDYVQSRSLRVTCCVPLCMRVCVLHTLRLPEKRDNVGQCDFCLTSSDLFTSTLAQKRRLFGRKRERDLSLSDFAVPI